MNRFANYIQVTYRHRKLCCLDTCYVSLTSCEYIPSKVNIENYAGVTFGIYSRTTNKSVLYVYFWYLLLQVCVFQTLLYQSYKMNL